MSVGVKATAPIPVTLTLPAQPPPQAEIDAMLIAVDALAGRANRG